MCDNIIMLVKIAKSQYESMNELGIISQEIAKRKQRLDIKFRVQLFECRWNVCGNLHLHAITRTKVFAMK